LPAGAGDLEIGTFSVEAMLRMVRAGKNSVEKRALLGELTFHHPVNVVQRVLGDVAARYDGLVGAARGKHRRVVETPNGRTDASADAELVGSRQKRHVVDENAVPIEE